MHAVPSGHPFSGALPDSALADIASPPVIRDAASSESATPRFTLRFWFSMLNLRVKYSFSGFNRSWTAWLPRSPGLSLHSVAVNSSLDEPLRQQPLVDWHLDRELILTLLQDVVFVCTLENTGPHLYHATIRAD